MLGDATTGAGFSLAFWHAPTFCDAWHNATDFRRGPLIDWHVKPFIYAGMINCPSSSWLMTWCSSAEAQPSTAFKISAASEFGTGSAFPGSSRHAGMAVYQTSPSCVKKRGLGAPNWWFPVGSTKKQDGVLIHAPNLTSLLSQSGLAKQHHMPHTPCRFVPATEWPVPRIRRREDRAVGNGIRFCDTTERA